jgi:hypothetical protein
LKVTASINGSGAFQKKPKPSMTRAIGQKPSAQNTGTINRMLSSADSRTKGMRSPAL